MLALGVQCVRGDHDAGQVDAGQGVQQRRERGDLVGLAVDVDCPSTTRVCWSITASRCRPGWRCRRCRVCREPRRVLPSTASTRRRPTGATLRAQVLHEPADHGVEPVGVHPPDGAADGRLRRTAPVGAERSAARRAGRRPIRRSRRTSAPRPRPRTPSRSTPRPADGGSRDACADRPPSPGPLRVGASATGSGSSTPPTLLGDSGDGQGCRCGHGSLPMIETGVRTVMITTRAVPAPSAYDRVSPQLSAHSPRLCRPRADRGPYTRLDR